ncbi:MAG: hypothetical protein ABWY93_27475 [Mycobacterium sp.]
MTSRTYRHGTALAAAGICVTGALLFPAVASAAVPTTHELPDSTGVSVDQVDWHPDWHNHPDWHHPEWGAGWNDGYPAPGWVPPAGWVPPNDWAPPVGWAPPIGYAPPPNWVPPCAGPLFGLFHPLRCA